MNLENFLQHIVSFTSTLDPRMAILLFVLCAIGEVGLAIPYILESIWLLVGFNIGAGEMSPWHVIILWVAAQAGRQTGTIGLYYIARLGMPALTGFYHKIHLDRIFNMLMARSGAVSRINLTSPFSVAFGRMVGMRIPMLLVMAAKKRLGMLSLGVLLSSIIWDALYMAIGAIFGSTVDIEPGYMLLISVGGLTVIYLITFTVRILVKRKRKPAQPSPDISAGE
jgi:membrane protein DedA with SNARE-associated domain